MKKKVMFFLFFVLLRLVAFLVERRFVERTLDFLLRFAARTFVRRFLLFVSRFVLRVYLRLYVTGLRAVYPGASLTSTRSRFIRSDTS